MIRAYLFDYGGTLDGEGWHWFDRMVELYRRAGSDVPPAEIKRAFYVADERLGTEAAREQYRLRALLERHVAIQGEVLGEPVRKIARELADGFCTMTEEGWRAARASLSILRRRARLGVVSNFYGNLTTILDEAGLAPLLEVTVESAAVGVEKPDPAIYRIALERLELPAEQVCMVGDNFDRDVRPAVAIGMRAIWLSREGREPPQSGLAERTIRRLAEIG